MVLCKFYAQGNCRFGDDCRFEHPGQDRGTRNNNRFATFQSPDHSSRDSYRRSHTQSPLAVTQQPKYTLSRDVIIADLSTERPTWILSAYTPSPKAPRQLFEGPMRERSCEEMRLHYYAALAAGTPAAAIQEADALAQNAEQQMQQALSNIDGAMDYIRKGEDEHPNRLDVLEFSMKKTPNEPFPVPGSGPIGTPVKPFSNTLQPTIGFGQPAELPSAPSPFGAPSQSSTQFGLPIQTGGFGQPSELGQKLNPFIASSAIVPVTSDATRLSNFAGTANPFGASSQSVLPNPFGQSPQAQTNPLGQPTATGGAIMFGQTTAPVNPFGNSPQLPPDPFGATSTARPFGVSSQPAQVNPFGQAAQPTTTIPFVQPSDPAATTNINPFRNPVAQVPLNPFGQSILVAPSATTNSFGPPASAPADPFTRPQADVTSTAPYPLAELQNQNDASAATDNNGGDPYRPDSSYQHPQLGTYTSIDARQRLTMFKGRPVEYQDEEPGFRNRNGKWERIWFPEGAPPYNKDTELDNEVYTEDVQAAYKYLRETRIFMGGVMPFIPPRREYCLWDF